MSERRNGAWVLLWLLPAALTTIVLFPTLGARGQGILPELMAGPLARLATFRELSGDIRQWAIASCVLAIAFGVLHFVLIRRGWRARLSTFDLSRVSSYRSFVMTRFASATAAGAAVVAVPLLMASTLSVLVAPAWVLLGAWVSLLSAGQCAAAIFGTSETRRLFRGM